MSGRGHRRRVSQRRSRRPVRAAAGPRRDRHRCDVLRARRRQGREPGRRGRAAGRRRGVRRRGRAGRVRRAGASRRWPPRGSTSRAGRCRRADRRRADPRRRPRREPDLGRVRRQRGAHRRATSRPRSSDSLRADGDVVLVSHEIPTAATREALRLGRAAGATTILNPAPAAGIDRSVFGLADVLTPNRARARGDRRRGGVAGRSSGERRRPPRGGGPDAAAGERRGRRCRAGRRGDARVERRPRRHAGWRAARRAGAWPSARSTRLARGDTFTVHWPRGSPRADDAWAAAVARAVMPPRSRPRPKAPARGCRPPRSWTRSPAA